MFVMNRKNKRKSTRQEITHSKSKHELTSGYFLKTISSIVHTLVLPVIATIAGVFSVDLIQEYLNPQVKSDEKLIEQLTIGIDAILYLQNAKINYKEFNLPNDKKIWAACSNSFYLFIRTDYNKHVISFQVISRSPDFHPLFPRSIGRLGRYTFDESIGAKGEPVTSRGIAFMELASSSRHSGYIPFWIGYYSNAGIKYADLELEKASTKDDFYKKLKENIRKHTIPNSYAYGGIYDLNDDQSDAVTDHEIYEIIDLCPKNS